MPFIYISNAYYFTTRRFVSFYYDLRAEGLEFPNTEDDTPTKKKIEMSTNPDEVSSQQEADDIAKGL